MSRKGDYWDNACSEALFGSLNVERLHGMQLQNHREAKDVTLDWLLWYNGLRIYSTLRYLSPLSSSSKHTLGNSSRTLTQRQGNRMKR